MKLLEIQWCGPCRDIPSKMKDYLLYLGLSTTMIEPQSLVGLFVFQKQHISYLGVLLPSIYQVTLKAGSFEWGLECKKGSSRLLCMLLYPLDHMMQQTQWYLRCWWSIEMVFEPLIGFFMWTTKKTLKILKQCFVIIYRQLFSFWETAFGLLIGLSGNWT